MRYYKPKKGPRDGTPAITVPRTTTQLTYLNIPLVQLFAEKGIDSLYVKVDEDSKEIVVRQARDGQKGYKIIPTGQRGFGMSPRLRKVLPAGKYSLVDRRRMAFARI